MTYKIYYQITLGPGDSKHSKGEHMIIADSPIVALDMFHSLAQKFWGWLPTDYRINRLTSVYDGSVSGGQKVESDYDLPKTPNPSLVLNIYETLDVQQEMEEDR